MIENDRRGPFTVVKTYEMITTDDGRTFLQFPDGEVRETTGKQWDMTVPSFDGSYWWLEQDIGHSGEHFEGKRCKRVLLHLAHKQIFRR